MKHEDIKKEMAGRGFYLLSETETHLTYFKPTTGERVSYNK